MSALIVDAADFRAAGALAVQATLAPGSSVSPSQRVEVTVTTDAGDREVLRLRPTLCTEPSGARFRCDAFVVLMQPGRTVDALLPAVAALGGRLVPVSVNRDDGQPVYTSATSASVELGSAGDLDAAMRQAERWPGVRLVVRDNVGSMASVGAGNPPAGARSAVRIGVANAPAPGDGTVQLGGAGALTVEYRQPDGAVLSTRAMP